MGDIEGLLYSEEELKRDAELRFKERFERQIAELQEGFFGRRHVGARLSNLQLDSDDGRGGRATKIMQYLREPKGFLIVTSPPGRGKTYLCAAIVAYLFAKGRNVYAMDEKAFMERIRKEMKEGHEYQSVIKYLCDHDIFILDDFGSTGITDWRTEVLFSFVDERYEEMRPTIITSNVSPDNFRAYVGDRGADRLLAAENTIISLQGDQSFRQMVKTA